MKTKRQIPTHSFFIEDAEKYGITCAVLLMHIRYWMDENRIHNINFHNGRYWTFSSVKNLQDKFPYLSEKQISTHLLKLENQGVLISDNFNKSSYDRTKWYSLVEESENEEVEKTDVTILPNGKMEDSQTVQSILPNGKMENTNEENGAAENVKPIPLTKEINKEIKIVDKAEILNFEKSLLDDLEFIEGIKKIYGLDEKIIGVKLDYFLTRKKLENKRWENQNDFNMNFFDWLKFDVPVPKEIKPKPAVINAISKEQKAERKSLEENYIKKAISFSEKLKINASKLETWRVLLNKECNHPKEFNSQAVYNGINYYLTHISNSVSKLPNEWLTFSDEKFEGSFIKWFKKEKHGSELFSETPNKAHTQTLFK